MKRIVILMNFKRATNYLLRVVAIAAICFPSLALAAGKHYLRMYEGPPLPRESVAILSVTAQLPDEGKCFSYTHLSTLDAKSLLTPELSGVWDFELLPGQHSIEVYLLSRLRELRSAQSQAVTFNAEAGHLYAVGCVMSQPSERMTPGEAHFIWSPTVTDITGDPKEACPNRSRIIRGSCTWFRKQLNKRIDAGFANERKG
jgi:hypothetical protein